RDRQRRPRHEQRPPLGSRSGPARSGEGRNPLRAKDRELLGNAREPEPYPHTSATVALDINTNTSLPGLQEPSGAQMLCGQITNTTCEFKQRTRVRFRVSDSTTVPASTPAQPVTAKVGLRWCQC